MHRVTHPCAHTPVHRPHGILGFRGYLLRVSMLRHAAHLDVNLGQHRRQSLPARGARALPNTTARRFHYPLQAPLIQRVPTRQRDVQGRAARRNTQHSTSPGGSPLREWTWLCGSLNPIVTKRSFWLVMQCTVVRGGW